MSALLPISNSVFSVPVCLKAHTGNNVQNSVSSSGIARCLNQYTLAWEQMTLHRTDDGMIIIKSTRNNRNLQVQPDGRCVFANENEDLWEKFEAEADAAGNVYFTSCHTHNVMQCEPSSGYVVCANKNKLEWERWRIIGLDSADFFPDTVICGDDIAATLPSVESPPDASDTSLQSDQSNVTAEDLSLKHNRVVDKHHSVCTLVAKQAQQLKKKQVEGKTTTSTPPPWKQKNKIQKDSINTGKDATVTVAVSSRAPGPQPEHITPAHRQPKFDANDPALLDYLDEYGYVVIRKVADVNEIEHAKDLLWEFLQDNAGMHRNDPKTWTNDNFSKIGSPTNGILFGNGFGQSDFQWYLRTLAQVKQSFAHIYGTSELICSFDGGNVFRPWHSVGVCSSTSSGWLHVDQGRTLLGRQCVQGLVTLTPVSSATGGFVVIPKSYQHHADLMKHTQCDDNYFQVPSSHAVLRQDQLLPIVDAGDMICWDSRTVHCSTPSLVHPSNHGDKDLPVCSTDELLRMAGYICMVPSSWATSEVIDKRLYESNMTTSHWPHKVLQYKIPAMPVMTCVKGDHITGGKCFSDASAAVKQLIGRDD